MAERVIERVLQNCRRAVLGGIPILYIKTDSDVIVHRIVEEEAMPLVVLRGDSASGGIYGERPIMERNKAGIPYTLNNIMNYKIGYPVNLSSQSLSYPCIWLCKMTGRNSGDKNTLEKTLDALEEYVYFHENKESLNYEILQSSVVILYSSDVILSPALMPYTEFIEVGYPEEEEIRSIILAESGGDKRIIGNEAYLSALCTDFLGFSVEEITMTMQKIMAIADLEETDQVHGIIRDRKRQKMEGGILEFCKQDGSIAGMGRFRSWLKEQKEPLKNSNQYEKMIGTPPPKGILLCGIPGCGKSEAAKFTAQELRLPLLKMDVGSLMDKYQGESERKMRDALALAEAMSPCVLWIDELEKGFGGAGSNEDSSFKRMFGYMLGWMQDNQKPCFIFATANDIGGLPKEFFRSGRFDALYAVYLPTETECIEIFKKCMEKAENAVKKRAVRKVSLFSEGCSSNQLFRRVIEDSMWKNGKLQIMIGADIQKVVSIALRRLYTEKEIEISAGEWEKTLKSVLEETSVYGSSEENVDSIAVSYCRMLRKGFTATADKVLFESSDYHISNREKLIELKKKYTGNMNECQLAEHEQEMRKYQILQPAQELCSQNQDVLPDRSDRITDPYDIAVYELLLKRINDFAPLIEEKELEKIGG